MENKEIDLLELIKIVWGKKRQLIKYGVIGVMIGVVVAFSIPKTYRSVVKMASENKKESSGLGSIGGLAAIAGINIGSESFGISDNVYPEIMKSAPFLLSLAQIEVEYDNDHISFYEYITKNQKKAWWSSVIGAPMSFVGWVMNMGKEKKEDGPIDMFKPTKTQLRYIKSLNELIKTTTNKSTKTISIEVNMQDPYIAAIIADSLLSNLQIYMTNYKTSKARADLENNERLLKEAQVRYYKLDSTYAIAQDRNRNLIMNSAQVRLERLSDEKNLAYSIYQQIATEVEMGRLKVQEDTPIATVIEPASVPAFAISPNKPIIVLVFIFLSVLFVVGKTIVPFLLKDE